jgi:thiamine biosynthesis lipoprotein
MNVRLAADAMGTRFELVLSGEDEFFLRGVGEEALEAVWDEHRRLSVFEPGSLLSRVNAGALGRAIPVDGDLFALLETCRGVWEESEGAFDAAVGGLMRRWGHRGELGAGEAHAAGAGFGGVVLDRGGMTVRFEGAGVSLDLGGIAKGYALDRAAAVVRGAGVTAALLHGGTSSIVAIGSPPGRDGWRVRIGGEAAGPELVLRDIAASVSAPSGRVSASGAGHVMDPRTGRPAADQLEAVVVGESGTLADAWATALVVLGRRPDRMPAEMGSAVRTGAGWAVSSAMGDVFRAPARDGRVE